MRKENFAVFVLLSMLVLVPVCHAVDIGSIDRVRSKGVLESEDLRIIDDFVAAAVEQLFLSREFNTISKLRITILQRKDSSTESAQAQYAEQFSESSYKYLSDAFERAKELALDDRKTKTIINLLILVDGLGDVRLLDLALGMVKSENKLERYWAVHAVTNESVLSQLNSGGFESIEYGGKILRELQGVIPRCDSETLRLITEFTASAEIGGTKELLLQIADKRISEYAGWSVDNELLDAAVLKLLYDEMNSSEFGDAEVARRFCQLYSYVMQKYIKDIKGGDFLTVKQRSDLASVLVEVEKYCIGRILGLPQSVIKKSVERGDYMAFLLEHGRLFGDESRVGQLSVKLNFDYGELADGSKRTVPLQLPERLLGQI